MGFNLRPYQEEAIKEMLNTKPGQRTLIALPTGSGKTVLMAELVKQTEGRVLIVVPSSELRTQTIDKIKINDPNVNIGSVQATLNETESDVCVATRQSLTIKGNTRIQQMLKHGSFSYVLFDEAHQAPNQIKTIISKINKDIGVIGLTATPYNKELFDIFPKVNDCSKDILYMIDNKFLVEPKAIYVQSKTNLSKVKIVAGEFNQKQLNKTVNNTDRNNLIVESYKKYAKDRKKTIVFCSGVEHMNEVIKEFNNRGILCKGIDGQSKPEYRKEVLKEFSDGVFPVLCNVQVLAVGFDEPSTDCIILAKPIKSPINFTQVVGRGLRLSDGKENCLLIDINDVTKNQDLMSVDKLFKIKINSGETLSEAKANREKEKQLAEEKRKEKLRLTAINVELFNKDLKGRMHDARYDWFSHDVYTYILSCNFDEHFIIKEYKIEDNQVFKLYKLNTKERVISLLREEKYATTLISYVEEDLIDLNSSFLYKSVKWKKEPATEKQLNCLKDEFMKNFYDTKWKMHNYFVSSKVYKILQEKEKEIKGEAG